MKINSNIDTIYNVKMSTHFKLMHMNYYIQIPQIYFKSLQRSPWVAYWFYKNPVIKKLNKYKWENNLWYMNMIIIWNYIKY